jgi:hypothetical protein
VVLHGSGDLVLLELWHAPQPTGQFNGGTAPVEEGDVLCGTAIVPLFSGTMSPAMNPAVTEALNPRRLWVPLARVGDKPASRGDNNTSSGTPGSAGAVCLELLGDAGIEVVAGVGAAGDTVVQGPICVEVQVRRLCV